MTTTATIGITNSNIQYPSLLKRVQAMVIDLLFILVVFTLSSFIINSLGEVATAVKIGIFVSCVVLYEPLFVAFTGGTLGHKSVGIQVKKYNHPHANISIFSAIMRIVVKALLGWISFLTISFNSEKRAIHDMTSGSIVKMK